MDPSDRVRFGEFAEHEAGLRKQFGELMFRLSDRTFPNSLRNPVQALCKGNLKIILTCNLFIYIYIYIRNRGCKVLALMSRSRQSRASTTSNRGMPVLRPPGFFAGFGVLTGCYCFLIGSEIKRCPDWGFDGLRCTEYRIIAIVWVGRVRSG